MRVLIFVLATAAIIGAGTQTVQAQHAVHKDSRTSDPLVSSDKARYRMDIDWGYSRRPSGDMLARRAEHVSSQTACVSDGSIDDETTPESGAKACGPMCGVISVPVAP